MHSQERRPQLKRYFYTLKLKKPAIVLAVSLFLFYNLNRSQLLYLSNFTLIVALISFSWIIYQLVRINTAPADETVDAWLQEDIQKLVKQSYQKLGIEQVAGMPSPLVIISPVYWYVRGIDVKELQLRKGKDKVLRFSVYQITIFHLDEYILASYICHYNFLRGVSLHEMTKEYHYKDIISVSTQEVSSNYHLPDGQKLVHVQEFRLSVASGENISVTINPHQVAQMEKAQLPPTGADKAVSVIRNMLRTKKV